MTAAEMIQAAIERSQDADPRVIARRVLPRLDTAQRDELLIAGLERIATELVRAARREPAAAASGAGPTRGGRSRWQIAMEERVCIEGVWRHLADCSAVDLHLLADEYAGRARAMAEKEQAYRTLAVDLERSGCATVGELRQGVTKAAA